MPRSASHDLCAAAHQSGIVRIIGSAVRCRITVLVSYIQRWGGIDGWRDSWSAACILVCLELLGYFPLQCIV